MTPVRIVTLIGAAVALTAVGGRVSAASHQQPSAESPLDARIQTIAQQFARGMGDQSPTEIAWVAGRRKAANRVDSGAGVDSNPPVYLIAVRGHFVDRGASVPYGAKLP